MQAVLGLEADLRIVAEAESTREAVQKVREQGPDVVLLDMRLRADSGVDVCVAIKAESPGTKVVFLTASDDEADLFSAIKAGASGYVLKDQPTEEIAEAIRLVHTGGSMMPERMATSLIARYAKLSDELPPIPVRETPLTRRELDVLSLVAKGRANREIAKQLFITENTVKNHVRNLMHKLQVHSRVEAAVYAMQHDLHGTDPLIDDAGSRA